MPKTDFKSIDEYIETFPKEDQERLQQMRKTIQKAAPDTEEVISYQMPTFRQNGILVHFAAHKNHIGFYPTPTGVKAFQDELSEYETSKGAIKFPNEKPLPLGLISRIVAFRVEENSASN
ncbi:DUF1801 domain-containing protein [Aliifodinibius sp. S!AR15-10]|uniref:iron chaperone n=1 Tax=Aliifodinibius sp. S!AR15-10 TaxID=2950437 RepID=UPI00285806A4|nr:DUF1801 domain-containing protein [Aliifodinibius sp. S!AR15-10]MDR8393734.1 DUF1801 domain-containing protein [Aliifodinibius sp. S!AR15-10]